MKRQLSSKGTFFAKVVMPCAAIVILSGVILGIFFGMSGEKSLPLSLRFMFLALPVVAATILYWTVMKYMAVSIADNFLYVSNYMKEISIPLSNVEDVTEIVWLRGHPVTIHLKTGSEFGKKITFMPQTRGFNFFSSHPVVAELKELARINNGELIKS
jgi:hypothetical protein